MSGVGGKLYIPIIDFTFVVFCIVPNSSLSHVFDGNEAVYCSYSEHKLPDIEFRETAGLQFQSTLLFVKSSS